MKSPLAIALLAGAIACGCGRQPKTETTPPPPPPKADSSSISQEVGKVVDSVTGIQALQSGRRAQDQVKDIQADYNRKMEQALDENQ